jgi:hypothetical protein
MTCVEFETIRWGLLEISRFFKELYYFNLSMCLYGLVLSLLHGLFFALQRYLVKVTVPASNKSLDT